jgi:PAS domain S-box-containing protein
MTERILVVDDDPALLRAMPEALGLRLPGVEVETVSSGVDALNRITAGEYDVVVTDIKMPGMSGLDLLAEVRRIAPQTPTLLITGHGEHDLAVQALRRGAYDFIQKPIEREYIVAAIERAMELRRANRELERQRLELERHAHVLEHLGEGVFLVSDDGTISLWNAAAAAITGIASSGALGRQPGEVLPSWDGIASLIPVEDFPGSSGRPPAAVPVDVDGAELWLMLAAVQLDDGVIYSFRDVTHERTLDELKADFVATISHELRTPLGAIYGAAETIRHRQLDEPLRDELLMIIARESVRLSEIVTEILSASMLEHGGVEVAVDEFDAADVARAVVDSVRLGHRDADRIRLAAPQTALSLSSDRDKLHQVLVNLIDNALKYSPADGSVELRIEQHERHVLFIVKDEGPGIPPREQSRIFDKFYRLDPQHQNGVGGTGLGLYICRELVHRMGGRISVISQRGRGSIFVVELPLARVPHTSGNLASAVS